MRQFGEKGETGRERAALQRISRARGEYPFCGPFLMKVCWVGTRSEPEEELFHAKDQASEEVADQIHWLNVVSNRVKGPD